MRNLQRGDPVLIGSTIACGSCAYCRGGYYSQCDRANPNGPQAGTAFFGGPASAGGFNGLQAEYALIPFAHVGAVKLPDDVSDEEAILLSDIFPTAYFAADIADVAARVEKRMRRWLRRRGLLDERAAEDRSNVLARALALEACMQMSLFGRTYVRLAGDGAPRAGEEARFRAAGKGPWVAEASGDREGRRAREGSWLRDRPGLA